MSRQRLILWSLYVCAGTFLAFIAIFVTGYKFWSRPPEASAGLDAYVIAYAILLFVLQFSKYTRTISWWTLPVMGYSTFLLFDPNENYGELSYQISIAAIMSLFSFILTHRRRPPQ